jgi:hypothetical protein
MGCSRLALTVVAASFLIIGFEQAPARAQGIAGLVALGAAEASAPIALPAGLFHHGKRVQSYYCYPRNYWWFYRPYTTASQNFPRCMPYFHYLDEGHGRGPRQDWLGK